MSGSSMNTFWSLLIEPGKTYERTVESGIHVTRCALDTSAVKSEADEGLVQVILEHCNQATTVANLSVKHSIFQTDLDLFFQCGEEVSFTTSGVKIPVTLTGLCGVDLGDSSSDDDDYEEGSCDDTIDETFEADDDADVLGKRKINKTSSSASKKSKYSILGDVPLASDSDSDDEHYNPVADDSSMLVDEAEDIETETDSEQGDDSDLSEDDEEESDDEVVEEESITEESPVKTKKPKKSLDSKAIKALKPKIATPEQKSTPKPSKIEKLKNKEGNKSPSSTPNNVSKAKEGKQMSGKENREGKITKGEKKLKEPEVKGTPKSEKKKKSKQILTGSVTSEDVVVGNGKVAKNNSMVSLYYDGRFKSGKVLDQCLSGHPFKFRLGKGEVIKGWDVGVAGMKEGGKRKLCIPAAMAYGSKGIPGDIPPNSDLVFDVTLMKVL